MLGKRFLQKNYQIPKMSDLKLIPREQYDEDVIKGDDQHLTDEKQLRESNIRERNTMPQNKNCVHKLSLMMRSRVPLELEPAEEPSVSDG
jgi:hypothetical protein